jgi:hypothetical protein
MMGGDELGKIRIRYLRRMASRLGFFPVNQKKERGRWGDDALEWLISQCEIRVRRIMKDILVKMYCKLLRLDFRGQRHKS